MSPTEAVGEGLRAVARIAGAVVLLPREATYIVLGAGVEVGQALLDTVRRMLGRREAGPPGHEPRKAA